jgi:3-oxoacyl-[acyl-carrier-protein] synthase II
MRRRVVITGCGVLSAIGLSARATWEALVDGRVGIRPLTLFDAGPLRARTAAQIPPFEEDRFFSGRERIRASRGDRIGLQAAVEAVADAGLPVEDPGPRDAGVGRIRDGDRAGVVLGGGGGGLLQAEEVMRRRAAGIPWRPSQAAGFFPATTTDLIAARLGARGPVETIMNACSSSTAAIGLGAAWIAAGRADLVLAGGVETLSRTTCAGFNALRLVDPDPCRPFDRDRRGLSLGECAAFLVLEEADRARRRGAAVRAEVAGWGLSADAHHPTAPDPDGAGIAAAVRAAVAMAGATPADVGHVNAHGTATDQNDIAEARALRAVFGRRTDRVAVNSIKGMVGHCLGAAGAIEAFAAAMSVRTGIVPPTAGLRDPDPRCELDLVRGAARRADVRLAVSISAAFGGNNAAVALRRWAA